MKVSPATLRASCAVPKLVRDESLNIIIACFTESTNIQFQNAVQMFRLQMLRTNFIAFSEPERKTHWMNAYGVDLAQSDVIVCLL